MCSVPEFMACALWWKSNSPLFPIPSIPIVLACESHSQAGLAWVYARRDLYLPLPLAELSMFLEIKLSKYY